MAAILQLETVGLRHGAGREVLSSIDLELARGEVAVVTGAAMAGKSTLLALAALALAPSRGRLMLFGLAPDRLPRAALPDLRRRIGFVGEALPLLPALSIKANVALPLRIAGMAEAEIDGRVDALLDEAGLGAQVCALPASLSSGERRRAEVARAVVARPEMIVADAPADGIDAATARLMLELFARLTRTGSAILLATRDEALAVRVPATRRYHLVRGLLAAAHDRRAGTA